MENSVFSNVSLNSFRSFEVDPDPFLTPREKGVKFSEKSVIKRMQYDINRRNYIRACNEAFLDSKFVKVKEKPKVFSKDLRKNIPKTSRDTVKKVPLGKNSEKTLKNGSDVFERLFHDSESRLLREDLKKNYKNALENEGKKAKPCQSILQNQKKIVKNLLMCKEKNGTQTKKDLPEALFSKNLYIPSKEMIPFLKLHLKKMSFDENSMQKVTEFSERTVFSEEEVLEQEYGRPGHPN